MVSVIIPVYNTEKYLKRCIDSVLDSVYKDFEFNIIETLKQYGVVIVHPKGGNITREQVQKIRVGGTYVLGYILIGEDMRTQGMTSEQMQQDERFRGDRTGPGVDPRSSDTEGFDGVDPLGEKSPGGTGFASYYLDDNNLDGKPDMNVNFNCAFTNYRRSVMVR